MLITNCESNEKQQYIESLALNEAEDSSYDSDCDNNDESLYQNRDTKQKQNEKEISQLSSQQYDTSQMIIDHELVSRTISDTLGQEFAEYVTTTNQPIQSIIISSPQPPPTSVNDTLTLPVASVLSTSVVQQERSPGYTTRVEFALKLGYTERLVQAALARLGPDPAQNELLAELIKLGAQHGNKGDFVCDSPTADCLSSIGSSTMSMTSSTNSNSGGGAGNIQNTGTILLQQQQHCGNVSGIVVGGGNESHHLQQQQLILQSLGNNSSNLNDDSNHQLLNGLRPIVIDGSNVAMSHGNKEVFSCRGIKLCVDWFKNRGHKDITVFVPKWRKESSRPDNPIIDQDILNELERERMLVFTPSRLVGGKRMVCYDDRYILKLAADNDGIVVSNDNYRDLVQESSEFKKVVEERVLMYSFVNDRFMPPDDPLGRSGPTLDNFLRIQPKKGDPPPPCPYGKKCTYGNKCKFHHPERGLGPHKSVTERLSEHAARHLSARNSSTDSIRIPVQGKSLSVPLTNATDTNIITNERLSRKALCRTRSGAPDCGSTTQQQQQQQSSLSAKTIQQHQQQSPIPNTWDQTGCHIMDSSSNLGLGQHHICFPKSHSIENISRETYGHSLVGQPPPTQQSQQQQHQQQQLSNYPGIWSPNQQQQPGSDVADESVNLHRKLRRQLTLNAAGCDPRIYQLQRCMTPGSSGSSGLSGPSSPSMVSSPGQSHSPHRPLAPSLSGPRTHHPAAQWDLHQSVTRIASAPDPYRPWNNGPPPASSSEPHINLWPHHAPATVLAAQDQRRRLHYHLASIFPEEQVQTVMQMYPDETNPQTICAAILTMFPKI